MFQYFPYLCTVIGADGPFKGSDISKHLNELIKRYYL